MQETQPISKRLRLVERTDIGIDLEYNKTFAILHIAWANKFNKSMYREVLMGFEGLKDFLHCMGYNHIHLGMEPTKTSERKIALRLGFTLIGHNMGFDIYELKIGE